MIMNINGADVTTPREAARFLSGLSRVYAELVASLDQFVARQRQDGVSGEPLMFLNAMRDQAAIASDAMAIAAERAVIHASRFSDTYAADKSLAGTQSGGYGDAARL